MGVCLSKYPLAPARSALNTDSVSSYTVNIRICTLGQIGFNWRAHSTPLASVRYPKWRCPDSTLNPSQRGSGRGKTALHFKIGISSDQFGQRGKQFEVIFYDGHTNLRFFSVFFRLEVSILRNSLIFRFHLFSLFRGSHKTQVAYLVDSLGERTIEIPQLCLRPGCCLFHKHHPN